MTTKTEIETDAFTFNLVDGICYTVVKEGAELGLDEIKEAIAVRKEIQQAEPMLSLTDIRNVYILTNEARAYAARSKELKRLTMASAILTSTLSSRLFANFYLKFDKPNYPTKIFSNEREAKTWLNSFNL